MIIDNENETLSRSRIRRIDHRNKINIDMKLLLDKIKSEKKTINKDINKIKQLEILLVKIKYADKPDKLESALRELNKREVIDKILHEIKNEILLYYVGAFETAGNIKLGDQTRQTLIRLRNMDDFEAYIKAIDLNFESENAIFKGYI